MRNEIALPQGKQEWLSRMLTERDKTEYLWKQVAYIPDHAVWRQIWNPEAWRPDHIRPGIIIDPVFTTWTYRVYWWAYDLDTELFVPAFDPSEPPAVVDVADLAFFHFFPQKIVVPAFKAMKDIR